MTDWLQMVSGDELQEAFKIRKNDYISIKVNNEDVSRYQDLGYDIISANSKKTVLKKKKEFFDIFENEVWQVFYKMGYKLLNKDNTFKVEISGNSKQLDVVAVDDETILVVECKASATFEHNREFKQELESIKGYLPEVRNELMKQYPNRKFKHIFAVKNCEIKENSNDMQRINEIGSAYFSYDSVLYYRDLTDHLGSAAKYQLLGNIFQKTKIKGLENQVPAIEGKMGGLTYYTFLIEPEKLLKLAYILHRHNANISNFPTYQRLVKKDRLKAIRQFVNDGGYFPNSLICSIDGNIKFEKSNQIVNGSISRTGILHLPQTYMSMYIIDGQHRLYGYSESQYASNNVVPVVAFVNMDKNEQVKMFMDINENQKAVSKSLRNTLNADLLWESPKAKERQEALMIKIAEALGEDANSPWLGRVLTGEESKTLDRCITTEAIKNAIKDSSFLNTYDKDVVKERGTFDKDNNDATYNFILEFLKKSLAIIKDKNIAEWEKGSEGNITINNTSYALIRIIDDIVNLELKKDGVSIAPNNIYDKCKQMILKFADVLNSLDSDTYKSLRLYGDGGKKKAWRALQVSFNSKEPSFINDELSAYIDTISTRNNEETLSIIKKLEPLLRNKVKKEVMLSANWAQTVGTSVSQKMFMAKSKHEQQDAMNGVTTPFDMWDVVSFEEIVQIIKNGANWSGFMSKILTNDDLDYNKQDTIDWLELMASAKKKISNDQAVIERDFLRIKEIYKVFEGEIL